MANTGYIINTKLKKVSDDANEYPLDVNNMIAGDPPEGSGLPQDTMDMPPEDPRYREPSDECAVFTFDKSKDFQKVCIDPEIGTTVTYSETYYSDISEVDAENNAITDEAGFNIRGQENANTNGDCLPPLPSDAVGIIQVDLFDGSLDSYAIVDTASIVDAYNKPCYTGNNFVPMDGTEPRNCWLLASDYNEGNFRHQFNVARAINNYPAVASIDFAILGRSNTAKFIDGAYSLKGADAGYMVMGGSPGSYVPGTASSTTIGTISMSSLSVVGGGDGTIGPGIGQEIVRFRYNVALKTLTKL